MAGKAIRSKPLDRSRPDGADDLNNGTQSDPQQSVYLAAFGVTARMTLTMG